MSTGAKKQNQSAESKAYDGGNTGTYAKNRLHQPPRFMGKSGESDNASTMRPKGKGGS